MIAYLLIHGPKLSLLFHHLLMLRFYLEMISFNLLMLMIEL